MGKLICDNIAEIISDDISFLPFIESMNNLVIIF